MFLPKSTDILFGSVPKGSILSYQAIKFENKNIQYGKTRCFPDQALVTSGFSNWKKAIERFKDHKHLVAYKNAVMTISASKDAI